MNNFTVSTRQIGDVAVLDLHGKLKGCGNSGRLRDTLLRPLEEGHKQILLNLADVSHIDSSCLNELVSSRSALSRMGGQIKLVHLTKNQRELTAIKKLLTVFEFYATELEALDSYESRTLELEKHPQAPLVAWKPASYPWWAQSAGWTNWN
jgi:anti-anti-sigma factor